MAGTPENPLPDNTREVEPKVKVQAIVTYLLGVGLLAVLSATQDSGVLDGGSSLVTTILGPLVPVAIAFLSAYNARHQFRVTEVSDY